MSGQIFHYQPDLLNLLIDTIPRLCRSKKDVLTFFSSAGVEYSFLADLTGKVSKDPNSISKYKIARTVLVKINASGDTALRERREIVKRVVEFEDFSRCWPNDQLEARGLVAQVRNLVNVKDSLTRLQQEHTSKLEEERKKRQEDEATRLEGIEKKRQERKNLSRQLTALYQEGNPQRRGKKLESILNSFFKHEGILVKESFTINGENNEGIVQQIDGAIEVKSHLYLAEMKWWKAALSPKDVAQHVMRIFQRSDVRGVFISASGYTEAAVIDIKKVLNQRTIVLFTVKELVILLEGEDSFEALLEEKVKAAHLSGELLFDP